MRQQASLWIVALLILLPACAPPAPEPSPVGEAPLFAELRRTVEAFRASAGIPGLSAAAGYEGRLQWAEGFGLADVENRVPARAETVYRLASISKPITAVATLQLAERGRLDLDAPIRTYVPSFPKKRWPVTARQILCHQSGIRHYNGSWFEFNLTVPFRSPSEAIQVFQDDPLVAEPGTKVVYSTFAYVLLGAAIESAAAEPYLDYVERNIFIPAGMEHTQADSVHAIIPNRSRGYRFNAAGKLENCDLVDTSYKLPGGGLSGTAPDLVRFALAVRQGTLLEPETVRSMWEPQRLRDGTLTPFGLGWRIEETAGRRIVGHSGNQNGVTTHLVLQPESGCVVALMANLEKAPLPELGNQILALLEKLAPATSPARPSRQ